MLIVLNSSSKRYVYSKVSFAVIGTKIKFLILVEAHLQFIVVLISAKCLLIHVVQKIQIFY